MKDRSASGAASTGMDLGWAVTSTMMSGMFLFGGAGWLLDLWWGTRFVVAIGVIVGLALGVYAIVMRYGRDPAASGQQPTVEVDGGVSAEFLAEKTSSEPASSRGNAQ